MRYEEEIELAKRIKKGDQVALEKLTNANLRLVYSVAEQYKNHGLFLPDLISEGQVGLIEAAYRFDKTKECKFSTYANWWISQSILKALATQSIVVRFPLTKLPFDKINSAFSELEQTYQREPSKEELTDFC